MSWATYPFGNTNAGTAYVGAWNGSWSSTPLTPPNGTRTGDVNLSWDSSRNRFVFTVLDSADFPNIWYGHSTDYTGSQWVFGNKDAQDRPQPVFSVGTQGDIWDYPSIGVDATGRIILGGVKTSAYGFYAALSMDGEHFGAPGPVPPTGLGITPGAQSRVVAAGSLFEAFVPVLQDPEFTPTAVYRIESSDAVHWTITNPAPLESIGPPLNSAQPTGSSQPIFYAPRLSAAGSPDGRWIVGFQRNDIGWNNVELCMSDLGCMTVNAALDDEFLAGVSVSSDGYWVTYHTYWQLNNRSLPLITQAIYLPTGGTAVGATTTPSLDPTSWVTAGLSGQAPGPRCTSPCYAAGDFNTPSSNPYAASNTAYVASSPRHTDLFQSFLQDPQAIPNVPNFVPNIIFHPFGADLRSEGLPVPPASRGIHPRLSRGF